MRYAQIYWFIIYQKHWVAAGVNISCFVQGTHPPSFPNQKLPKQINYLQLTAVNENHTSIGQTWHKQTTVTTVNRIERYVMFVRLKARSITSSSLIYYSSTDVFSLHP